MMKRSFSVLLILLAACSSSSSNGTSSTAPTQTQQPTATSPEPTSQPTATATPTTAPTASAPQKDNGPVGSWTSPSCTTRKYVRNIDLTSQGTFMATDLVSPCPPNAKCVWSGIHQRKGTWKLDGDKVILAFDEKGRPGGEALPTSFTWSNDTLTEFQGPARCDYSRR